MAKLDQKVVLIVEDKASFRQIYRDALESAGYAVIESDDGHKAWDLVKSAKPDLILLDIIIPGKDGFSLLEQVRAEEDTKHIPVIILSVLGESGDIHTGFQAGANDYVVKGSESPADVVKRIDAMLKL